MERKNIFFKNFISFFTVLFVFIFLSNGNSLQNRVFAVDIQEEVLETQVIEVLEEKYLKPADSDQRQLLQKLKLKIVKGSLKGETIEIESGSVSTAGLSGFKRGDNLLVVKSQDSEGRDLFYISEFNRRETLLLLFLLFVIVAVAVAGIKGALSLLGMAISFAVIFLFILPQISKGQDPVMVAVLGSLLIIPVTFFFSHGFNKKTMSAVMGTFISLVATGILALIFVSKAKLTGFATEEAGFLQFAKQGTINIRGLLLAGIIVGVLGILDDITVSQSGIVFELKKANEKLNPSQLYKRAMNVGRDHISSMVNTLVLVYTGASLPLLLLFIDNPRPFSEVINYEIIADEIVRTLVGSLGLILAVPVTTAIAVFIASKRQK